MYYSDSELKPMNRSISEWLQEYRLVYDIPSGSNANRRKISSRHEL